MDMEGYVNIKQVASLMETARKLREDIDELRAQAMSLNSPNLQKEIVSKSHDADAVHTKIVEKYIELQKKYDKMLSEPLERIEQATNDIEKIEDVELKNIALMKYIQGAKIREIAESTHMDCRTVSRKLKKIDELLKVVS